MMKKQIIKWSLLASNILALLSINQTAQASGYQNSLQSVEGMGRAYAGEVADSSVLSTTRNPANLMLLKGAELSNSFMAIDLNYEIETTHNPYSEVYDVGKILRDPLNFSGNGNRHNLVMDQNLDNAGTKIVIPALAYGQNMGNWGYGLAMSSHFAYEFDPKEVYTVGDTFGDLYIKVAHLTGNLAYQLNDQVSVGLGLSGILAWAKAERNAGELAYIVDDVGSLLQGVPIAEDVFNILGSGLKDPNSNIAKFKGDGLGYGWSLGFTWQPTPIDRFAIVYTAKSVITVEGEYESDLPMELNFLGALATGGTNQQLFPEATGGQKHDAELDIELPAFLEMGGWHQFRPDWELFYSVRWTNWTKAFDGFTIKSTDGSGVGADFGLTITDNIKFAVGLAHDLTPAFQVRGGFAVDEAFMPSEENMILNAPDSRRWWLGTGATWKQDPTTSWDLGLGFIYFEGDKIKEPSALLERTRDRLPGVNELLGVQNINIEANVSTWIAMAGIQLNKKF